MEFMFHLKFALVGKRTYIHTTTSRLHLFNSLFQDNLGKPAPER